MENTHYWKFNRWDEVFPLFLYAMFLASESHFSISGHLLWLMVGKNSSKKVPALAQGFEWAYVPGVELYSVLEQGWRHFLPRITHTVLRCATVAN